MEKPMTIFKKLFLLGLVISACPALLRGMDQETDQVIMQRSQRSGYLSNAYRTINPNLDNFSNKTMSDCTANQEWRIVGEHILAGCNLDCLFKNNTVTQDHIREICSALKAVLNDSNFNTNDIDHTRITNFLQGCLNSKKVTYEILTEWFPADTKNINKIMPHLRIPDARDNNLISNINIYKIIIPVAAVIALAALAYKWWSKQAQDTPVDDETENQTAATPAEIPQNTLK
jgi:hypothetical protein